MPTPGLTAGRVNGGKKHSGSYAARTASLPDLRRWPGDESCAHARIEWSNPVPTPELTAERVNGEKKHTVSDAARTASLTLVCAEQAQRQAGAASRRWPL